MVDQLRLPDEYLTGWLSPSPRQVPVDARGEITRLRAAGYGSTTIARNLNARGVPTPSGRGVWYHSTVHRHCDPEPWRRYIAARRARMR